MRKRGELSGKTKSKKEQGVKETRAGRGRKPAERPGCMDFINSG